jgi:hypothetical protein
MEGLKTSPLQPRFKPPDIDGFIKIKQPHKGKRYQYENELIRAYEETINKINLENSFKGINMLPFRWESVNQTGGEYIK